MTDKEKLIKIKKLADAMYFTAFNMTTDASLLMKAMKEYHQFIINEYWNEEPVSEVWYNAKKTLPESSTKQIICIKEDGLSVATVGKIVTGTIKWAYLDTLLHISNKNLTESQCRKLIDTAFELGKTANKDKPVSENLEKAEERAMEAYPPKFTSQKRYSKRIQSEKTDVHQSARTIYIKGYHQAEKDLEKNH